MTASLLAGVIVLVASQAFAQSSGAVPAPPDQARSAAAGDPGLATPTGHEVNVSIGGYTYIEPGSLRISIHGAKIGGGYAGTLALDDRRHWFVRADARATFGNTAYDGWCAPWLIRPDSASPNGYALGLGDYSPCRESGDRDWYVEARGVVGRDFVGPRAALSPYAGVGVRHLSNGTTGIPGFRTQKYLYVPVGVTVRTRAGQGRALGVTLEYDRLLRGWQTTRESALGSGDIPPTAQAPGFTINGFTDLSFTQRSGWALRASATYPLSRRWSLEPSYLYWSVGDSSVSDLDVAFTVNQVRALQRLGAYEPTNVTHEFAVKLGYRF